MVAMVLAGITKSYAAHPVLEGVDLEIGGGEVHALMGENGAGKSTLARIIAGIARPDRGTILLDGVSTTFANALDAQARGVAIIHQELDLFPHLSIAENIVVGNLAFAEGRLARRTAAAAFARPFLTRVGLDADPAQLAATLPIAHQQLVAIARALSMNCRILLMDEPSSALSDEAVERLFTVVERLRADGVAIVYVSHKMNEIERLCDRVTVLRDGRAVATRRVADVSRPELIAMMVGRPIDLSNRRERQANGPVRLTVSNLVTPKLQDVSFQVRAGEVLGIAGLVGAGRSELGAALVGLDPILAGTVEIDGRAFAPRGVEEARARGVMLLPEDRKLQGLMLSMAVRENASLAVLGQLSRGGVVDGSGERSALERVGGTVRRAPTCRTTPAGAS